MRSTDQLRREETFDLLLDARFGSEPAAGSASDVQAPAVFDDELEAMARVAGLVRTHVERADPTAIGTTQSSHTLRGISIARIAAVVLLLAGLGAGLGLAASRARHAPDVPAGALTIARMPTDLYDEIESEAAISGNPYPRTPVLWVRTTARAADELLGGYQISAQASVPARTVEWVGQVTSRFYGDPEHKTAIYSTILDVWTPRPPRPSGGVGFENSPVAPVPLSLLEQLGTVHRQYLQPPPPAPVLPPGIEQTLVKRWARLFGNTHPSVPVLWVKTTVGTIGKGTDRALGLPTSPEDLPIWVVDFRAVFGSSATAPAGSDWSVTTETQTSAWRFTGRRLPQKAERIAYLAALGRVHDLWLNGGPPMTMPQVVKQNMTAVLRVEYRSELSTLRVAWVGTTAGRLRSELPWTPIGLSVPGPTPVWIVEVKDAKALDAFSNQWFFNWGHNPSGDPSADSSSSLGGSSLFGITRLSQLGSPHALDVVRPRPLSCRPAPTPACLSA